MASRGRGWHPGKLAGNGPPQRQAPAAADGATFGPRRPHLLAPRLLAPRPPALVVRPAAPPRPGASARRAAARGKTRPRCCTARGLATSAWCRCLKTSRVPPAL